MYPPSTAIFLDSKPGGIGSLDAAADEAVRTANAIPAVKIRIKFKTGSPKAGQCSCVNELMITLMLGCGPVIGSNRYKLDHRAIDQRDFFSLGNGLCRTRRHV